MSKVSKNKRIISCAITGAINVPSQSPYLPITPSEIAENAIGAAKAGAASVHIHVRNPITGEPVNDLALFEEVHQQIRKTNSDVIICFTTGGKLGSPVAERGAVVPHFKPELASLNAGSINWGLFRAMDRIEEYKYSWEYDYLKNEDQIFPNTFKSMKDTLTLMKEAGTKPELEVYDIGQLYNIQYLLSEGYLEEPLFIQFVTGILGGINSTPYDIMNLHTTAERLFGRGNYEWSVVGAGKTSFPSATMNLILGGHVRVGLEDNTYLKKGVLAKNNAELVEKIVRIASELGFSPATPDEAREILGIKR